MTDPVVALARAEDRLRAHGLTGARAFEEVVRALRSRLGDGVVAHPAAAEALGGVAPGTGLDLLGLAYERFFADLFKGRRGQYFTPEPLAELLVALAGAGPGDDVLDPTCGSGGLLVCAARRGASVRGIDRDPLLAELAGLNLRMAGASAEVTCADFFAAEPRPADVVIANPPFSVTLDEPSVLNRWGLDDRILSDALFARILGEWVRPGGRAAVILPTSVLANPSGEPARRALDAAFVREAVVELPEGVFRPFGGAAGRACVLALRRRPTPDRACRWAAVADPGWDVRLGRVVRTGSRELAALGAGEGFVDLPGGAWRPGAVSEGVLLAELADPVAPVPCAGALVAIDLADADKGTGEVVAASPAKGRRSTFRANDILVARMRPELGNVAWARDPSGGGAALTGSAEWVPIRPRRSAGYLLCALRGPAWRRGLPPTSGQTRPRISADDVWASRVRWPGDPIAARVDAVVGALHQARAQARRDLAEIQAAVDAFTAGEASPEDLDAVAAAIAARRAPRG